MPELKSEKLDVTELKCEESTEQNKQAKHTKWILVKKLVFKEIYNSVYALFNNNIVAKTNDHETITMIPLGYFLTDIINNRFHNRDDAVKYIAEDVYPKYGSKLESTKDNNGKKIRHASNKIKGIILKPGESFNQQVQGIKILTPKQMIIRLPILLAQLKAENNSEKPKTEIRQLEYSLYRSRYLSKKIYDNLIGTI